MGLGDIIDQTDNHSGRAWPDHGRQEELEDWMDELSQEFPGEVRVDFIEVSPQMTKCYAKAYWDEKSKERDRYIRVSKDFFENHSDDRVKAVILHELVHIWFFQEGYTSVTERDERFTYVLGAVGAHVSGVSFDDETFNEMCGPFSDFLGMG